MSVSEQRIAIGAEEWKPIGQESEEVAYLAYACGWSAGANYAFTTSLFDDAVRDVIPSDLTASTRTANLTRGTYGGTIKQKVPPSITVTMVIEIGESESQSSVIENYQSEIESLPVVKRAQLFQALNTIDARLLDLDFSEDGQIVIQTQENGRDCFYAICTKEGDFKGTWLPDGSLIRHSWSATLPYWDLVLSSI
jgi:hypothetical protein